MTARHKLTIPKDNRATTVSNLAILIALILDKTKKLVLK